MDDIRIGLIGVGNIGVGSSRGQFVPQVCRFLSGVRVKAVFDVVEENATRTAGEIEDCRAFGLEAWEAFLDSGINAVVVASPIPFHVEQSVACLDRGIHVLCEVTAAGSIEEARILAEAAERSKATYMLAENCNFIDEIELCKRMARDGLLGEIYHADGAYLHDCKHLWRNQDGSLTWRGSNRVGGAYCTHNLGPILSVLQDRITRVSCFAATGELFDPEVKRMNNYNMLMRTAKERTVTLRVDSMNHRPYNLRYCFQGTGGIFEYVRDGEGESKVVGARLCLTDDHEWHSVDNYTVKYLADRKNISEKAAGIGHGGMEYWMMKTWLDCLREERSVPLDVHTALDCTLPGILARESALRNGETLVVPDSRKWIKN